MVTKKAAPKSGGDKTTGPVTTSDMNQPAPKADPGAAPAAKTKDGKPEDFVMTDNAKAMQAEEDRAVDEMNDRRKDYAKAEKHAGVEPDPTVVPQGPSALRDWQVSNTPAPQDVQRVMDNVEAKRRARVEAHR